MPTTTSNVTAAAVPTTQTGKALTSGGMIIAALYVRVRASDGLIHFALTGTKTNPPSCATANYWMIRDESSNTGKQQYAMLLAAQLAGKSIAVSGSNTCARWVDGEDANEIRIVD